MWPILPHRGQGKGWRLEQRPKASISDTQGYSTLERAQGNWLLVLGHRDG